MENQTTDTIYAVLSAVAGSVLTIFAGFCISIYRASRRADNTVLKLQMQALGAERELLNNAHEKVRADLQGQILELRKHLLDLQSDNLKYVRENAELRQQVIYLTQENGELKVRLRELEAQVARLTDGRMVTSDANVQVTKDATNSLGTAQ